MMYDEFISRLPENLRNVSRDTYTEIEFIYNYYMGIVTMDEIAQLYTRHGMREIWDMCPWARRAFILSQQCEAAAILYGCGM